MRGWLAALVLWAGGAAAGDIESRFVGLVSEFRTGPASLTLLEPDGTIHAEAAVGMDPTDALPILSVSKSLAGACTMHLARTGRLSLEDTVGQHLGWSGPGGAATIGALLTHTSGYTPDRTQRDLLARNFTDPERVARLVATREGMALGWASYDYNNENYLVLEAALTAIVGAPAVTWCPVNTPALAAMPSLSVKGDLAPVGLAGGFAANTRDLARFTLGLTPAPDWPRADVGPGIAYGPGIVHIARNGVETLSHRGGFCTLMRRGMASMISKDAQGWAIAITYSRCPDRGFESALQEMLEEELGLP